jgi:hypothetical protein
MNEKSEKLNRISAAMKELKYASTEDFASVVRQKTALVSDSMSAASDKFVANPSQETAKVFLTELERSAQGTTTSNLMWTTITITIRTNMSDDHGR